MAIEKVKIGLYSLHPRRPRTEDELVDPIHVLKLLFYAMSQPREEKLMDITKEYRYVTMQSLSKHGRYVRCVLGSGRYRYRPNLRNRRTAVLRENPKSMDEGDDELTHLVLYPEADGTGFIFALEEHRGGVSRTYLKRYLQFLNRKFGPQVEEYETFDPVIAVLSREDFWDRVEELNRVLSSELFVEKSQLGSEALRLFQPDRTVKNVIKVVVSAMKQESLKEMLLGSKSNLKQRTNKIRIFGSDEEGNSVIMDTDMIRNVSFLDVNVDDETGEVSNGDAFTGMEALLRGVK